MRWCESRWGGRSYPSTVKQVSISVLAFGRGCPQAGQVEPSKASLVTLRVEHLACSSDKQPKMIDRRCYRLRCATAARTSLMLMQPCSRPLDSRRLQDSAKRSLCSANSASTDRQCQLMRSEEH